MIFFTLKQLLVGWEGVRVRVWVMIYLKNKSFLNNLNKKNLLDFYPPFFEILEKKPKILEIKPTASQ